MLYLFNVKLKSKQVESLKSFIIFLLIPFLSASIFAEPSVGSGRSFGGPAGGFSGGPAGHGGNGGRGPSTGPSIAGISPAHEGGFVGHVSPPSAGGAHSAGHSAPVNLPEGKIMNYRGTRTAASQKEFSLQSIKSNLSDDAMLTLEIRFNQSVNPLSFKDESIILNGENICNETKLSFNKKGDTLKISVPFENKSFSLLVQNVESFGGKKINPVELKEIYAGSTIKNLKKAGGKNE